MDYGIFLDSCYFNKTTEECNAFPSHMNITNIRFENFTGTTTGVYGNAVARLSCSINPSAVCENITLADFHVDTPCGGEPVVICDGIANDIGVDCVSYDSEEGQAALRAKCVTPVVDIDTDPWGSGSIEGKHDAYHPLSYYPGDEEEEDDEEDCDV